MEKMHFNLCDEFDKLNIRLKVNTGVVAMEVHSTLPHDIHKVSHPVLRPKPDAHRMYAQDQVVIHTVRM
jgi:hypothetical protein